MWLFTTEAHIRGAFVNTVSSDMEKKDSAELKCVLGPEDHLGWSQVDTKLDSVAQSVLQSWTSSEWCTQSWEVTMHIWGYTTQSTQWSESHMDANISFQEVCGCTVGISCDAQRKCRFSRVSEILFIDEMLNHKLHFQKTLRATYASVYLTG